ncbi:MAG: nitroreductase family protein [Candidatus Humimicrobiaceae bacterium]
MKEIFERRSIRKYTDDPVSDENIEKLLKAAMAAPTAGNQQEWEFIVIKDRHTLNSIPKVHPYATMLKKAPLAIAICADRDRESHVGYWVQDCAAATQNILLEAQHLGLGACWLGIYPREKRVKGLKKILSLPDNVMPLSLVAVGNPADKKKPADRFDKSKIHINKW